MHSVAQLLLVIKHARSDTNVRTDDCKDRQTDRQTDAAQSLSAAGRLLLSDNDGPPPCRAEVGQAFGGSGNAKLWARNHSE